MVKTQFISSYRGESDYHVDGLAGRVSVRACSAKSQAFYGDYDPQLLGTVVNRLNPVPDAVLDHFNGWVGQIRCDNPHLFVPHLVTAKWYPSLGWIRCES